MTLLEIYMTIGNIIANALPNTDLWIDLDRGQLKNPNQHESLILPSLLIGFDDGIKWKSSTQQNQTGQMSITLKIVVRLPEPIFFNSKLNQNIDAISIEDNIHIAFTTASNTQRIHTRMYPVNSLFVIEHTYIGSCDYTPAPLPKKQVSLQINTQIKKP